MHKSTLTGTAAKDLDAYFKDSSTKQTVKNKKKQNETPNKPIL